MILFNKDEQLHGTNFYMLSDYSITGFCNTVASDLKYFISYCLSKEAQEGFIFHLNELNVIIENNNNEFYHEIIDDVIEAIEFHLNEININENICIVNQDDTFYITKGVY